MNQPSYLFTMEHGKVTIGAEILWPQTETDLGNSETLFDPGDGSRLS